MKERAKIFYTQLTVDQRATVAVAAINYSYDKQPLAQDCQNCAACCYAFSIPGIKESGEICANLAIKDGQFACTIYENRPEACRDFSCEAMPTNTPLQRARITQMFSAGEKMKEARASCKTSNDGCFNIA